MDGCGLTVEVNTADVLQQLLAPCMFHLWADTRIIAAQILVHLMEGMSHGINSIDHKLNSPLLLIVGVFPNSLLSCTVKEIHTKDIC